MTINLNKLIEQLEINDQKLNDIKNQIQKSLYNEEMISAILSRQCLCREEVHCLSCNDQGNCFILNGIIYLGLNDPDNAIKELENANWNLRSRGDDWNSIIGLTLLGLAFEERGQNHLAFREYNKAYETLSRRYLRIHANDYTKKHQTLKNDLQNKLRQLSNKPLSTAVTTPPTSTLSSVTSTNNNRDYLALFSIPIYGSVEAGPDGIFHIEHLDAYTIVNQIELQGRTFDIHGIHGTTPTDRQITVTTKKTYGWMRIHGLSMNGWDLPFNENDYVLFYKTSTASHLDYVIVSNNQSTDDIALIVKRFDEKNDQLLSKSKNTSKLYNPIPLDKDHQIVGIVIAIAKPIH